MTVTTPATTTSRPRSKRLAATNELARRDGLLDALVVIGPTLLGLGLCLYQLTTRSLWLDESATFTIASQHGAAFGAALAHDGGNMLAYYALLHVLIGWFGSGLVVLRLPAAVATAVTVGLVAVLGLRLSGRRVALVAGVLTAVSLSLVYWGQNARGYTAMVALVAASFLALLALLEGRGRWGPWVAYVAATTAAIYVGLEAVLVVPAQLVALVWFRSRWRSLASAVAVTAACCAPLAVLAAQRGAGQLFWVPPPGLGATKQIVQALTSSGLQPSFYTSTSTALLVLTLVVLACAIPRAWQLARLDGVGEAWRPGLLLAWLLVPAVVALIESAVGNSIFQARYLLVSLPAVSLLLAWILVDRSARAPVVRWLSLGAVAALIALRALQLAPAYGVSTENWRAATSHVIGGGQPHDCIAFYPLDGRMAFRYYLRNFGQAPRPVLPGLPWHQLRPFVEDYASLTPIQLARLPQQCERVWLLVRHGGGAGGTTISTANHIRLEQLTRRLAQLYPASSTGEFGEAGLLTATLYSR
jgi:mannosyltransferase